MSHKDCIGQVIKVKDMIAYGDSHRTAGVNIGMVFEFTPKQIRTSIGNINPSYCVVITDQYKAHNMAAYDALLLKNKAHIVEDSVVVKKAPKMEYKMDLRFIGKNSAGGNKDYRDFFLEVRVYADGVEQGQRAPSRTDLANDIYEHDEGIIRHYKEEPHPHWAGHKRMVRSGKLEIGSQRYADRKDYLLAGTSVKAVIGTLPTQTKQYYFKGGIEAISELEGAGIVIGTTDRYSTKPNAIGRILGK